MTTIRTYILGILLQGQYYFWKTKIFPREGSYNVNKFTGILRSWCIIFFPNLIREEMPEKLALYWHIFILEALVLFHVTLRTLFMIFQQPGTCLNNLLIPLYPTFETFAKCLFIKVPVRQTYGWVGRTMCNLSLQE